MEMTKKVSISKQKAWIVFTNRTEIRWLKIFKPGFRHCFIILHDGKRWISIDPMAHYMDVVVQNVAPDFDLVGWLRGRGHKVISADLNRNLTSPSPAMLFTCVEVCKRIIGLQSAFIFTPWQLYRYIERQNSAQQKNPAIKPQNTYFRKGELLWEA